MPYDIYSHPIQAGAKRNQARYPIRQLQIGQSFRAPASEEKALRAAAAYVNSKFHKWGIYVSVQRQDNFVWCGRCEVPTEVTVYRPKA